jgi:hypothetical protein
MSMKEKTFIQPVLSGGPSFSPNDRASLLEVLQRSRRIETRLTRLLETEGIQTGIQRPWWANDTVMVPSPMTTIDAIMKCIPEGWSKPVLVLLKEDQNFVSLCRIQMPIPK